MTSNHQEEWPEHAVCARCAAPLSDDYRESPLGLRFCNDCFDNTIQEKVKERAAAIYVNGRCSRCGRSLINGYRLNQFGVIYCLSCSDESSERSARLAAADAARNADAAPNEDSAHDSAAQPQKITKAQILLTLLLIGVHLLFFLDFVLSGRLLHGQKFFHPIVSLDVPALVLLAILRHFPESWLSELLTLLLSVGYIILIVKQIIVIAR